MKDGKVKFQDNPNDNEEEEIDSVTALRLYDEGAFVIVLDLPVGSEFGVDLRSWNIGEKFQGAKMIPPGLHFIYYSPVSKEGQLAPRTGFFHMFNKGEVVVRKYDPGTECLKEVDESLSASLGASLRDLDSRLGPYPHRQWGRWVALSNRLTAPALKRLQPCSGPTICSVTQVVNEGSDSGLEALIENPETRINFTAICKERHPPGSTAKEITLHAMDSSYKLQKFLDQHSHIEEILVELQFSFICFLVAQNYDSFEHWKQLVVIMCGCDQAMFKYPQLFINFMSDLHFQMQEVPQDFFVDIISENNFLVQSLTTMFANIRESEDVSKQLKTRAISFENHLSKKFGWNFAEEDEEFSPVIVEM